MKNIIVSSGKLLAIALFASVLLALCVATCDAATPPPAAPPTMAQAVEKAEANAAKAIMAGNLKDAQGWAEVSMQLRVGQYMAPMGDLMGAFKDQAKNLPAFITAAIEVDITTPLTSTYNSPFKTAAVVAVMKNDPAALKQALVRDRLWTALWFEMDFDKRDKTSTELLTTAKLWIDGNCQTAVPPGLATHAANTRFTAELAVLTPMLVASK